MAPSAHTPTLVSPTAPTGVVEFPDNRLLIDLCGPYDANLAQIEAALDVQIVRRGNQLNIIGEPAPQADATRVLHALYARLEGGREVEAAD